MILLLIIKRFGMCPVGKRFNYRKYTRRKKMFKAVTFKWIFSKMA